MFTPEQIINKRKELWDGDILKDKEYRESAAKYVIEHKEIITELQKRPVLLIEMFFVIVDKDKNTVPLFLNTVQNQFINDLETAIEDYRQGKRIHLKFLVLKGRQQGFTTVITAYQLACSVLKKNFAGYTLADNTDNTETIFRSKAKYFFDNLPESLKPTTKYNSKRELFFDKINSAWEVATAGNKDVARSRTLNFFHGSESAFWSSIHTITAGLGQALTKDSIQILETTGNGYNEYKDLWDDDGNWERKFYEWWLTPEYRQEFESDSKEKQFKVDTFSKTDWIYTRCKWLIEFINLDIQQVYWYYNKWRDLKELIKQEYPCSADEAFLSTGRCVFDKEKIIEHKEYLKHKYEKVPYLVGSFYFEWNDPKNKDYIKDETIKFIPNKDGIVKIYEDKQRGYPYVVGGDTKGEGKDFYAGTVINNVTGVRCAVIHAQFTNSKPYTWQMYCLGRHFNDALIGVEMNFNTAPIEELERLHYPRQYTRQQYDSFTKDYQKKYGWKTDGNTRPLIIDKEIDLIESNTDLFNDIAMLDECLTFVYDKDNRPDAQSGKHDDILISDMIGNEIRSQQSYEVEEEPIEYLYPEEDFEDYHKGESFFD